MMFKTDTFFRDYKQDTFYRFDKLPGANWERLQLETNVNNLTQATTTYSVSFNWHGIPCAFLYL